MRMNLLLVLVWRLVTANLVSVDFFGLIFTALMIWQYGQTTFARRVIGLPKPVVCL